MLDNMRALVHERKKAEVLRRKGYSYSDILKEVKVAKSSLSGWLKNFSLTEDEKHFLKKRKDTNISRGRVKAGAALSRRRKEREKAIFEDLKNTFPAMVENAFFQLGVGLYWAEGSKRNSYFSFVNSDPEMISLMARWIERYIEADKSKWRVRLYTHRPFAHDNQEKYWGNIVGIDPQKFRKTVYKPTNKLVKKRPNYFGCLRVEAGGKNALLKAVFWQKLLVEYWSKQK